jgi:hypothetical protein
MRVSSTSAQDTASPGSATAATGLLALACWSSVCAPAAAQTFCEREFLSAAAGQTSVAIGDLDGDGMQDLVVTHVMQNWVSIMPGDGSGGFATAVPLAVGPAPRCVTIGDLDQDGDADLAVAQTGGVAVLLNQGAGSFAPFVHYTTGVSNNLSIAIADLDQDGDGDLAVAHGLDNAISVLFNAGDATFSTPAHTGVGLFAASVVAGDLDQDGDADLAVAIRNEARVVVLLNQGSGSFATAVPYATGAFPYSVAIGDLDLDGDLDLALPNNADPSVSVLLNHGDGTFARQAGYPTLPAPTGAMIGDLDGDGDGDLAVISVSSMGFSVLLNAGNGVLAPHAVFTTRFSASSIAGGDLDADGELDLVLSNHGTQAVSVRLHRPDCAGPIQSFCAGDGSLATPCPCGNSGGIGRGCRHSVVPGGALLVASGASAPDAVDLIVHATPTGTVAVFIQGDATIPAGVVFGDGVRCAGGALTRLAAREDLDFDGILGFGPGFGDAQVSVAGAVVAGNTYAYQTYYRNPSVNWCPPAMFNVSNGITIAWE